MRGLGKILICIFLTTTLSFNAYAIDFAEEDGREITLMLSKQALQVLAPWSKESAFELYSASVGSDKIYDLEILDMIITFSMFLRLSTAPAVLGLGYSVDPIDKKSREIIRDACLEEHGEDVWQLLTCVNRSVLMTVASIIEADVDRPWFLTACRTISSSVRLIINSYNIPGVRVSSSNILLSLNNKPYGHSVNIVTLTSDTGAYYSYTFDAGNEPNTFFPNNDYTASFHERNGEEMPLDVGSKNIQYNFRPK